MKVISAVKEIRSFSREAKAQGKTVGFVPTMGFLHEGHLSLVRATKEECDVVIVSIFVNPMQFGAGEDFDEYPRDIERDKLLVEAEGVDAVFAPTSREMYPGFSATTVEVEGAFTEKLCGASRPGHFKGVTTVVAKLFNIVEPDKAYFGQKDAQQSIVIKKMVTDLNMPVDVRVMPIVREEDGLAMSSRNVYLSEDERQQALGLSRSLERAKELVSSGQVDPVVIKDTIKGILLEGKDVEIDYIEIVDVDMLDDVEVIGEGALIAIAASVGKTRLIDNVIIRKH